MTRGIEKLDDCLSIRDGRLFVEECAAEELARVFGTPLHVVSEDQLRRNARRFRQAFERRWPGPFLLLPSIKANSVLALRRVLTIEGTGCDAFGAGELDAALRTATPPEQISLNGPMKDEALFERAVSAGVRITLDSRQELSRVTEVAKRLGGRAYIRLRVRPDLANQTAPSEMLPSGASIRDALQRYKAGIPTEDLLAITAPDIRNSHVDLTGIHLHLGRHSADPAMWQDATDALTELLGRLREAWDGWTPRELDLGGGFPAPRDPFGRALPQRADAPERSPDADAYAAAICGRLHDRLQAIGVAADGVRLEVEPGRGLYADAGVHLATVGNVKRQTVPVPQIWVETDTSDAYLPDVNLEFNRWTCVAATNASAQPSIEADITGRTCALDVVVPDAQLPSVESGTVLAFLDTGAYQDVGASNFNALPRPGTAMVTRDGAEMVRRHETIDDIFARDRVPRRLADGGAPTIVSTRRLDHVGVSTSDLDRSLGFYCDVLGLELRDRGEAKGGDFDATGVVDATVRWADVKLTGGQVLELIEFIDPRGSPSRPRRNDAGATHIALEVEDINAAHTRLKAAGAPITSPPRTIASPGPWHGARIFYANDPDGVAVELIERPPATGQVGSRAATS
jgi:diaminopimelate decarboxylase